MSIGFDLDKIFIDYPPFIPDGLIDRLYKKKSNGTLIYRYPNSLEQTIRKISHYSFLRPGIKANIALLRSIPRDKNKLYLISSRFGFLEDQTTKIMKKLGLDQMFDGIYFNYENKQPHEFKDTVLKNLNLDMYIDDDFALLKHVAKHNKHTRFYWLTNRRKQEKLTRNIIAINQLSDIFS